MMNNIINILAEHIVLRVIYVLGYVICYVLHSSLRIYNKKEAI